MKGCSSPLAWFFVALGVLSLGLGFLNYRHEQALFATYEPATATLTEWVPDPNYGTPDFCPVYEFTTRSGETRSYTGEVCDPKPDPGTVGRQTEEIYYDPANPYSPVESRGWMGSEGSGLLLGGAFFVFFDGLALFTFLLPLLQRTFKGGNAKRAAVPAADLGGLEPAQVRASERLNQAQIALVQIEELKSLRDANQISEADYQKRKREIQSKLVS
jgi:hypothetical protein